MGEYQQSLQSVTADETDFRLKRDSKILIVNDEKLWLTWRWTRWTRWAKKDAKKIPIVGVKVNSW